MNAHMHNIEFMMYVKHGNDVCISKSPGYYTRYTNIPESTHIHVMSGHRGSTISQRLFQPLETQLCSSRDEATGLWNPNLRGEGRNAR